MEESDRRETHAKVERHWYWVTDGTTWTCCFCCGISTHTFFVMIGPTVIPAVVVMVSLGLALTVFKNLLSRRFDSNVCKSVGSRKILSLT